MKSRFRRLSSYAKVMAVAILLAGVGAATAGPPIKVTEAIPAEGVQGASGLVVTIKGRNFKDGAVAKFFPTGDPSGIGVTVRSTVFVDAKTLTATVDILDDPAAIGTFDIEVSQSSGKGKGTELFNVTEKGNSGGPDTTAPGAPTGLMINDPVDTAVGFNTVAVSWTEPADDGYLPESGKVFRYTFWFQATGPITDQNLATADKNVHVTPQGETPLGTQSIVVYGALWPETDEPTLIGAGGKLTFHRRVSTNWVTETVDRKRAGGGVLVYDPFDDPAIAYAANGGRKGGLSCRLARSDGSGWDIETIGSTSDCEGPELAFDSLGSPAIVYTGSGGGLHFVYKTGGSWSPPENIDAPVFPWGRLRNSSLAYDPLAREFTVVYSMSHEFFIEGLQELYEVRFCRRDATIGMWNCEVVETSNGWVDSTSLTFDDSGTTYLAYAMRWSLKIATRSVLQEPWAVELIDWGGFPGSMSLVLDPGGNPSISFQTSRNPPGFTGTSRFL